jgi:hypothetical protein
MLPDRLVSVPRLREAAQARVAASSLSAAAREIGVTHRGLSVFLSGSKPQPKTLAKLLRWYREQISEAEGPPITLAEAVRTLVRGIAPERRAGAAEELIVYVRRLHADAGAEPPSDLVSPPESPQAPSA